MLDISKLDKVRRKGDKITAACPACRAAGGDKKGVHLFYNESTEGYGCVAFQKDDAHNKEIFALVGVKKEYTPEEKKEWAKRQRAQEQAELDRKHRQARQKLITHNVKAGLHDRLEPYLDAEWRANLFDRSRVEITSQEDAPFDLISHLFASWDVLWMGTPFDSGRDENAANFKTCSEWCQESKLPPRIAAGTFKEGVKNRAAYNVISSPYIVLESDDLIGHKPTTPEEAEQNKKLFAALILYAQKKLGLRLRAVIDTGNKSLHAWFDRPPADAFAAIRMMAAGMCLDVSVIDNCAFSPLRMPGCIHEKTNEAATLLYLDPKLI